MQRWAVLAMVGLTGCPGDGGNTVTDPPECPNGATELGTAGQFTTETVSFQWEWDNDLGVYVGPEQFRIVPDDIVSYAVIIDGDDAETAAVTFDDASRRWVDDDWYENDLFHGPAQASSIVFPISPDSTPTPGCISFLPSTWDEVEGEEGRIHYVTRRAESSDPVIDINVLVVDGATLFQEELDAALDVMDALYIAGGAPAIGQVQVFDIDFAAGDILDAEGSEPGDLRASITDTEERAMNVFFITDTTEGDTLGFAAGIPGANGIPGTYGSGVIIAIDAHLNGDGETLDTDLMGETLAHEVGHQLGLFHTSEADGLSHDLMSDTAECDDSNDTDGDGYIYAEECPGLADDNFMFWTGGDLRQDQMSPQQASVLFDSPIAQ